MRPQLNDGQKSAIEILRGNSNVFLTGAAGSGKSIFNAPLLTRSGYSNAGEYRGGGNIGWRPNFSQFFWTWSEKLIFADPRVSKFHQTLILNCAKN